VSAQQHIFVILNDSILNELDECAIQTDSTQTRTQAAGGVVPEQVWITIIDLICI